MAAPVRKFAQPLARNLLSDMDLSVEALTHLLGLAEQIKRTPARFSKSLAGRYLSLLFEKPSLRTRLTFELAIKQLGGDAVNYAGPIGEREPIKDVTRNLERWTQCIVARVFAQSTIEELAKWSHVPVINALSDRYHPCQILADMLTLQERFGRLDGIKLAFVGDGNNVANSLMLTAGRLGVNVAVATPAGYQPDAGIVAQAAANGIDHGDGRSGQGAGRSGRRLYRCLDQHGSGSGIGRAPACVRAVSSKLTAISAGQTRCDLSALPACQARRRSHG